MGGRAFPGILMAWAAILVAAAAACANLQGEVEVSEEAQWLAGQMVAGTMQAQGGFVYPEDTVTFGLLLHHLYTGEPPSLPLVDASLNRALQGQQIPGYRLRGFRAFWVAHHNDVNWDRFPMTASTMLFVYNNTYLQYKFTARQNALNHQMSALVNSEEAWRRAMNDWKQWETSVRTKEQISDAEHDSWRAIMESQMAVQAAEEAIQGVP